MSRDELFYLSTITGANEIIGIKDNNNLNQLSKAELANRWNEIKDSLLQKSYIQINHNGELIVDKLILFFLNACCHPKKIIALSVPSKLEIPETINYYLTGKMALEIREDNNIPNGLVLTPHGSPISVFHSISELIIDGESQNAENLPLEQLEGELPEKEFYLLLEVIERSQLIHAREILLINSFNEPMIEEIISGLVIKKDIRSLVIMDLSGIEISLDQRLFVFKGDKYWWELTPNYLFGKRSIRIQTTNPKAMNNILKERVFSWSEDFENGENDELIEKMKF